jgi:hypothetical protein
MAVGILAFMVDILKAKIVDSVLDRPNPIASGLQNRDEMLDELGLSTPLLSDYGHHRNHSPSLFQ